MKKITILGKEFEYKIFSDCNEHDGVYHWTEFYQGTEEETYRKYLLFGEKKTRIIPKFMFKVYDSIEDNSYTKAQMKEKLERKVELIFRQEEIERGEII
jgi:hypothetical protein